MPTHSPIDLTERARRYVGKMPAAVSGGGGHNATFHVACVLVQGFGLSPEQAFPLIAEFNQRCDPPWTEKDLWHKLRGADSPKCAPRRGRGFLAKGGEWKPSADWKSYHHLEVEAKKAAFDAEKLRTFSGAWAKAVDLVWLANRSMYDPARVDAARFLELLYQPGEKVAVITYYYATTIGQGLTLWPDVAPPTCGPEPRPCGVWFINQPVDGGYHPADEGDKMSCRNHRAVTSWRYLVIESDEADTRQWLGALAQLPLRIAALYSSGGRSVHALVVIDAPTKQVWDAEVAKMKDALAVLGADPKTLTAVRLTRLPGTWRHGKMVEEVQPEHPLRPKPKKVQRYERFRAPKFQKLLYIHPRPPLVKLVDLFPRRDVVKFWCERAAAGIADSDETAGEWITDALDYYAGVSRECAVALHEWKGEAA